MRSCRPLICWAHAGSPALRFISLHSGPPQVLGRKLPLDTVETLIKVHHVKGGPATSYLALHFPSQSGPFHSAAGARPETPSGHGGSANRSPQRGGRPRGRGRLHILRGTPVPIPLRSVLLQVLGRKLLADIVEALIGVHHVEGGPAAAEDFISCPALSVPIPFRSVPFRRRCSAGNF